MLHVRIITYIIFFYVHMYVAGTMHSALIKEDAGAIMMQGRQSLTIVQPRLSEL